MTKTTASLFAFSSATAVSLWAQNGFAQPVSSVLALSTVVTRDERLEA